MILFTEHAGGVLHGESFQLINYPRPWPPQTTQTIVFYNNYRRKANLTDYNLTLTGDKIYTILDHTAQFYGQNCNNENKIYDFFVDYAAFARIKEAIWYLNIHTGRTKETINIGTTTTVNRKNDVVILFAGNSPLETTVEIAAETPTQTYMLSEDIGPETYRDMMSRPKTLKTITDHFSRSIPCVRTYKPEKGDFKWNTSTNTTKLLPTGDAKYEKCGWQTLAINNSKFVGNTIFYQKPGYGIPVQQLWFKKQSGMDTATKSQEVDVEIATKLVVEMVLEKVARNTHLAPFHGINKNPLVATSKPTTAVTTSNYTITGDMNVI